MFDCFLVLRSCAFACSFVNLIARLIVCFAMCWFVFGCVASCVSVFACSVVCLSVGLFVYMCVCIVLLCVA